MFLSYYIMIFEIVDLLEFIWKNVYDKIAYGQFVNSFKNNIHFVELLNIIKRFHY